MAQFNIASTALHVIGAGGAEVSCVVFQITGTLTSVSIVPKVWANGLTSAAKVGIEYINMVTGLDVVADTPITAAGLFAIRSTGMVVALDMTYTSGTALCNAQSCLGDLPPRST